MSQAAAAAAASSRTAWGWARPCKCWRCYTPYSHTRESGCNVCLCAVRSPLYSTGSMRYTSGLDRSRIRSRSVCWELFRSASDSLLGRVFKPVSYPNLGERFLMLHCVCFKLKVRSLSLWTLLANPNYISFLKSHKVKRKLQVYQYQ